MRIFFMINIENFKKEYVSEKKNYCYLQNDVNYCNQKRIVVFDIFSHIIVVYSN